MSRKWSGSPDELDYEWFAVAWLAALDAIEISLVADGQETREPIGDDGLAFAVGRIRLGSEPEMYVHTRDGRRALIAK